MRVERRLFTIKDSKFTLDLTIRAFNKYGIRAATIYWRYRFRPHAAARSLPTLDQPRDHWRPENFMRLGINDTSIEPGLRWDNVILIAFHSSPPPSFATTPEAAARTIATRSWPKASHHRAAGRSRTRPNVLNGSCAPKARITRGGGFHPESCRLIRKLTSDSPG